MKRAPNKKLTEGQKQTIRDLHAEGVNFARIGAIVGVNRETAKRLCDPEFAAFRRQQIQSNRKLSGGKPVISRRIDGVVSSTDFAARLAEIPPDTRDLTGRICGDPLPGRSALDRRKMGLP